MVGFTDIFSKQKRQLNWKTKRVKKKRKRALKSLSWVDIEEINQDHMILKKGNMMEKVVGIKIIPPNIFLDTPGVQGGWVESLQFLISSINFELFHGFIYTPIELTDVFERLENEMNYEEDMLIKEMYQLDIDVMNDIERNVYELSFFIITKSSNLKKLTEREIELKRLFSSNAFEVYSLNQIDFSNLVQYEFESESMLDVYLSREEYEMPKKEIVDED